MIVNRFIIVFLSLSLIGCFGGGSSSSVVSSSKLDSGTTLTYNSSNATTQAATTEFQYFNYSSAASTQNPMEVINAHKAHGYGLTGSGETIAIIDTGFNANHNELNAKTITEYGTQTDATGANATADHGLIVSSVAAGEDDGTGMQGVAPGASLHLASYNQRNGNTYYPTHWANATDNASSAIVQNNSWGINYQIDTLQSDINSNSWSNAYGIAQKFHSSGYTANEASANAYITALDKFQDHGVIVYALSNTTSYTDADFQAALPVLFPQLEEAWITGVNVEITGSSGNETYTRKSAPCGSTGSYCLGADGYQIVGAAHDDSNTSSYWAGVSGTSFVAPQISGAIAVLAEAFPNHSPAELTDRLLASADNTFFSHDASVTFGNGVEHGYDDEFGHGILDIYAALNPITTSSYTRIYTGKSTEVGEEYQLGDSKLLASNSFGDSLQRGLIGEVGYTYDDLGGGFKYDMSYHVDLVPNKPSIHLSSELENLSNPLVDRKNLSSPQKIKTAITVGNNSLPVQSFFNSNIDSSINLSDYQTTYLEAFEGGLGVNAVYQLVNSRLLIGATVPIEQSNGQTLGSRKSLISSLEYGNPLNQSITLMAGLTQEKDILLGSEGTNAFSLDGSASTTTFTAFKGQKRLFDNFSLTGLATLAKTNMTSPSNSFVDSASDIKSSSVALIANMRNLTDDDHLSLFVNQPNRVNDGSIAIKIADLADSNGNISQTVKHIDLDSSSRQLNYGLSYRKDLNDDLAFSLKHIITNNLNHRQNSNILHSNYIGMNYKDIKFGFATNPEDSSLETELSYAITL